MTTFATYLRTLRLQWALTQEELGSLIGVMEDTVSKYEHSKRVPKREVLLAIEVVFGKPPRTVFPLFYSDIEESVMGRATALDLKTFNRSDAKSLKIQELLTAMNERAKSQSSIYGESA